MVRPLSFEVIPTPEKPLPIRVKFYKVGMLRFISHLDLMRNMTRIITRTHLPVWYSQGFNPRLKITFAMPLSIGTESECEFFDIRLTAPVDAETVLRKINESLTPEMQAVEVYLSDLKFGEIGWAEYEISLTSNSVTPETAGRLVELYSHELTLMKKSKSGDKLVDISPYIRLKSCEFADGSVKIRALLSADSEHYLNPEYLVTAARERLGITFDDPFSEFYSIVRKEVYLADGETVFR